LGSLDQLKGFAIELIVRHPLCFRASRLPDALQLHGEAHQSFVSGRAGAGNLALLALLRVTYSAHTAQKSRNIQMKKTNYNINIKI
jgi:hypothetical protein